MIGPEKLGSLRGHHHDRPAGLAIADDGRLAFGVGMQRDHPLEEGRLGVDDVLDRLPRHGLGQEADEIAGMPGLEGDADLALRLEPADARSMAGARIDDDERPLARIDLDAGRRRDAHEHVVHRTCSLRPSMTSSQPNFRTCGAALRRAPGSACSAAEARRGKVRRVAKRRSNIRTHLELD